MIKYKKIIIGVLVLISIYIIDFTLISLEKKPVLLSQEMQLKMGAQENITDWDIRLLYGDS